ncbi:MAG: hypothetical protein HY885_08375 [Deltaproteobacteria bacterium]|nr:hypothetical protein [Deltaproteobacteria bacterium]
MKFNCSAYQRKYLLLFFLVCLPGVVHGLQGCAPHGQSPPPQETRASDAYAGLEEQWGIRPETLRLSAEGAMLDFRYRVTDPIKAVKITSDHKLKIYLEDQASGVKLAVPTTPKIGALRQTTGEPQAGKIYFCLFANSGSHVKAGSKVTVVMGDFRAENLVVE